MLKLVYKKLLALVVLLLSPLAMLAAFGVVYVAVQMINGLGFSAGINSFVTLIQSLMPYFPYLTTIPVVMILLVLLLGRASKLREKLKN